MLLLTGATGLVGSALLRRLTARGEPVRCLVRDPRRLGPERVRVQITIGDLTDPRAYRQALRGARTVVHLAASHRDQPHATIEELAGLATWRLLRAAEQAGVDHFVFFSALGASPPHHSRLHRAKAIAEQAVEAADLRTTTFAPSLVYSPGDRRLARLEHLALAARGAAGRAGAGAHAADLGRRRRRLRDRRARPPARRRARTRATSWPAPTCSRTARSSSWPCAPRTAAAGSSRCPRRSCARCCAATRRSTGPTAVATWDEAELLGVTMRTPRGTADAEALGVHPRALRGGPGPLVRGRLGPGGGRPGRAASSWEATCSSVSSPSGLPTSWALVGRPSSPKPAGIEIAGWPGDVEQRGEGRELARAGEVAPSGPRRGRRTRRSAAGARPARGEQDVVLGEERDHAARQRLQLGDAREVLDRGHAARELGERARQRLDLVVLRRAPGEQLAVGDLERDRGPERAGEQPQRVLARQRGRRLLDLVAERREQVAPSRASRAGTRGRRRRSSALSAVIAIRSRPGSRRADSV